MLDRWLDAAVHPLGLEAEPAYATYGQLESFVARAAPAVLRLEQDGEVKLALLLKGGRRNVTLLARARQPIVVPTAELAARLAEPVVAPHRNAIEDLLESAGIESRRRARCRDALLAKKLPQPVRGLWLLRESPGASMWRQMMQADLPRDLVGMLASHGLAYLLLLAAWAVVGVSALQGRLEGGWLAAWALLLLTTVPFAMSTTWFQGRLTIGVSGLLKRRLLHGVLRLQPDEVRGEGAGRLLGKVIESESLEALALGGGVLVVLSIIEVVMALVVLSAGASGGLHAVLLLGWLGVIVALNWRYYRRVRQWAGQRVELTSDLVERMVGHRTRLAQLPRERWHEGEDEAVERYVSLASRMDEANRQLMVLLPRGWMLLGVIGLAPAFIAGGASSASVAVSLGGILLAFGALNKASGSFAQIGGAAIAWEQLSGMYHAAAREEAVGLPLAMEVAARGDEEGDEREPVIDARDLHFAYEGRGRAVLRGANLHIEDGDKLLLEGGSGAGKSTFASLLIGLRKPSSGLLLLRGFDQATLGTHEWRRRVISAPQFHENHVLTGTFAFNLLMGSTWPASPEAIERAEGLCRELGLGPLLDRMPGGIQQMVGETGWQLSHGERSRLFMARALLQDADLVVLDESFAALDPEALRQTLGCVLERTPTLMVIAHP